MSTGEAAAARDGHPPPPPRGSMVGRGNPTEQRSLGGGVAVGLHDGHAAGLGVGVALRDRHLQIEALGQVRDGDLAAAACGPAHNQHHVERVHGPTRLDLGRAVAAVHARRHEGAINGERLGVPQLLLVLVRRRVLGRCLGALVLHKQRLAGAPNVNEALHRLGRCLRPFGAGVEGGVRLRPHAASARGQRRDRPLADVREVGLAVAIARGQLAILGAQHVREALHITGPCTLAAHQRGGRRAPAAGTVRELLRYLEEAAPPSRLGLAARVAELIFQGLRQTYGTALRLCGVHTQSACALPAGLVGSA